MSCPRTIGVVELASSGWSAGGVFLRTLLYSLSRACDPNGAEVRLLSRQPAGAVSGLPSAVRVIPIRSGLRLRGEWTLRRWLGLRQPSDLGRTAREHGLSVLLPLVGLDGPLKGVRTVGWIPDFQHVHLPHYFSPAERGGRDRSFRRLIESADRILLSSRSVRDDFLAFAPAHAAKARVVSFPSLYAFDPPSGDPHQTRRKFHLPEKFALVANQFWNHKNHETVVDAIGQLRRDGLAVPVVMTGLPADFRDPENQLISRLLQSIACAGLAGQVIVLGLISETELRDLMRVAAVVIQPSRFEGWSTVVQNAKALGRPLICSDIPVHREQAPDALGFFPCDEPGRLAELLRGHWPSLAPGPDAEAEANALAAEQLFVAEHGRALWALCEELMASND